MSEADTHRRPYRSRKQKPCNACRKRKICCVRSDGPCLLCQTRGIPCVIEGTGELAAAVKPPPQDEPSPLSPPVLGTPGPSAADGQFHGVFGPISDQGGQQLVERYVGLSSDLDPFILRHRNWPQIDLGDESAIPWKCQRLGRDPISPAYFTTVLDDVPNISPESWAEVENILEGRQGTLFKAYHDHIHTSYPLLACTQVDVVTSPIALQCAIYLLAKHFCSSAQDLDVRVLERIISETLRLEAQHPSLTAMEAALLFAQRHGYSERFPGSPGVHTEDGMLTTMASDLGLHINPSDWSITETAKRRRKRLWWAVYVHDKWSALALGRPQLLHDDQSDVDMLTLEDFSPEGEQAPAADLERPSRIFIAMISLTMILSQILNTFYTVKAKQEWLEKPSAQLLEAFSRLDRSLATWRRDNLDVLMQPRSFPDPIGSAVLGFCTLKILLYRAVLIKLERQKVDTFELNEAASEVTGEVIALLENLSDRHTSVLWWPFSHAAFSIVGSFILSRFLASVGNDTSQEWAERFSTYRQLLELHGTKFPVTKYAMTSLDALADQRPRSIAPE